MYTYTYTYTYTYNNTCFCSSVQRRSISVVFSVRDTSCVCKEASNDAFVCRRRPKGGLGALGGWGRIRSSCACEWCIRASMCVSVCVSE